jgi:hypothetical protein
MIPRRCAAALHLKRCKHTSYRRMKCARDGYSITHAATQRQQRQHLHCSLSLRDSIRSSLYRQMVAK